MNSLSWMIYLASVSGGVGTAAAIIATVAGLIGGVVLAIFGVVITSENGDISVLRPWVKGLAWVVAPCLLVSAVLPSKSTVYAIAASEMGETALNSETGGKAVEALNAWLDRQIADEPEDQ